MAERSTKGILDVLFNELDLLMAGKSTPTGRTMKQFTLEQIQLSGNGRLDLQADWDKLASNYISI